ncbi:MAG: hypothetical protein ACUVWZ_16665 [Anaerolineae bacterium]
MASGGIDGPLEGRDLHAITPVFASLFYLVGLAGGALYALEPPTPDQWAQYQRDGSLAERQANAFRLGNPRAAPFRVWDTRRRLEKLLRQVHRGGLIGLSKSPPPARQGGLPASGTPKVLVLPVDFSDHLTGTAKRRKTWPRNFGLAHAHRGRGGGPRPTPSSPPELRRMACCSGAQGELFLFVSDAVSTARGVWIDDKVLRHDDGQVRPCGEGPALAFLETGWADGMVEGLWHTGASDARNFYLLQAHSQAVEAGVALYACQEGV